MAVPFGSFGSQFGSEDGFQTGTERTEPSRHEIFSSQRLSAHSPTVERRVAKQILGLLKIEQDDQVQIHPVGGSGCNLCRDELGFEFVMEYFADRAVQNQNIFVRTQNLK
ncbi:hypothetical protein L596_023393 [Steinernema carpocapsae]|uniref:Uncharacterized protein n=1 Tax=Steinernema carpocapsae TaxID=34508 RepID=A0A4U5MDH6_STECR|nr:hypothetical protein L596_023393 [Steinernema carpocapsae]